jgi:hypothetical protein
MSKFMPTNLGSASEKLGIVEYKNFYSICWNVPARSPGRGSPRDKIIQMRLESHILSGKFDVNVTRTLASAT